MVSSHALEPMVNKRRLPDTSPGNDCDNIYLLVCPCIIQERDILFSAKNITSCNGESSYGNILWCKSCWRLAGSDTRSGRERLQEALTSDSTPCVDSACYRRYRLQKFGRVLKAPPGVFLEEHVK